MKRKKSRRSRGIWIRGYVPILFLIIALCITIQIYVTNSGMIQQLRDSSDQSMNLIVQARTEYIASAMTTRWGEMTTAIQMMNDIYDELVASNNYTIKDIISNEDLYVDFLNEAITPTIDVLRRNVVSGVYIILADTDTVSANETFDLPGIFLRDRDPTSAYNSTNKDLLFERAPISVVQKSGISTDSFWSPNFSIGLNGDLQESFFKVYNTALKNPGIDTTSLGYWSSGQILTSIQSTSFYYIVPLISNTGEVYGVMGIDILKSYFAQSIPHQEISNGDGAYGIYKTQMDDSISFIDYFSKSGRYLDDFWLKQTTIPSGNSNALSYRHNATDYIVQTIKLNIYDAYSPFSDENWYIYAVAPRDILYQTTNEIIYNVTILIILLMVIAIIGIGIIIYRIAKPIKNLEHQLKTTKLDSDVLSLDLTGISELDLLATAIETLNADVRAYAGKFSQLLEMSSISLGAFEFHTQNNQGFISHNFFHVFGDDTPSESLELKDILLKLQYYQNSAIPETIITSKDSYECICEFFNEGYLNRFVRIKLETSDELIRAFVEDVSIEWREIRKLAYERNHDNLTDIYNRRGFYEQYYSLMKLSPEILKTAIVIMLDLDNLKLLNDTYGHSIGDLYIKTTAQVLKKYECQNVIVSRISGDEFLVFSYGYQNQLECNEFISKLEKSITSKKICISDDNFYPLHISAGIAYYPKDSIESNELVRFADFAMYQGKRTFKGRFTPFDKNVFDKEEIRLKAKEALDEFIRKKEVLFYFQPIICAKTMTIFAYEALMRPQNSILKSPLDVLNIAKAENRLQEIESICILGAIESFSNWCQKGIISNQDCKIFLNTITNERLKDEEVYILETKYKDYLTRTVVEYTENEQADPQVIAYKHEIFTTWGASTALDDYGSGYNGENMLLETKSKYVKLDMHMIKNIHIDDNRKQRVIDLINYTHKRGILVVAEGIELKEECIILRELGVDFLQGYYLAKPDLIPPTPEFDALL